MTSCFGRLRSSIFCSLVGGFLEEERVESGFDLEVELELELGFEEEEAREEFNECC